MAVSVGFCFISSFKRNCLQTYHVKMNTKHPTAFCFPQTNSSALNLHETRGSGRSRAQPALIVLQPCCDENIDQSAAKESRHFGCCSLHDTHSFTSTFKVWGLWRLLWSGYPLRLVRRVLRWLCDGCFWAASAPSLTKFGSSFSVVPPSYSDCKRGERTGRWVKARSLHWNKAKTQTLFCCILKCWSAMLHNKKTRGTLMSPFAERFG